MRYERAPVRFFNCEQYERASRKIKFWPIHINDGTLLTRVYYYPCLGKIV